MQDLSLIEMYVCFTLLQCLYSEKCKSMGKRFLFARKNMTHYGCVSDELNFSAYFHFQLIFATIYGFHCTIQLIFLLVKIILLNDNLVVTSLGNEYWEALVEH